MISNSSQNSSNGPIRKGRPKKKLSGTYHQPDQMAIQRRFRSQPASERSQSVKLDSAEELYLLREQKKNYAGFAHLSAKFDQLSGNDIIEEQKEENQDHGEFHFLRQHGGLVGMQLKTLDFDFFKKEEDDNRSVCEEQTLYCESDYCYNRCQHQHKHAHIIQHQSQNVEKCNKSHNHNENNQTKRHSPDDCDVSDGCDDCCDFLVKSCDSQKLVKRKWSECSLNGRLCYADKHHAIGGSCCSDDQHCDGISGGHCNDPNHQISQELKKPRIKHPCHDKKPHLHSLQKLSIDIRVNDVSSNEQMKSQKNNTSSNCEEECQSCVEDCISCMLDCSFGNDNNGTEKAPIQQQDQKSNTISTGKKKRPRLPKIAQTATKIAPSPSLLQLPKKFSQGIYKKKYQAMSPTNSSQFYTRDTKLQANNKGKKLVTKSTQQKVILMTFFRDEQAMLMKSTDYWDKEKIEQLAHNVSLSFKKTYKWLWDTKERLLSSKMKKTEKNLFTVINVYSQQSAQTIVRQPIFTPKKPIKPIFKIEKVHRQ